MLEKTWRWFGPSDLITLDELRRIDVEGIVTSLHHLPKGAVWETDEIMRTKRLIESHNMRWSVVESLPVSEEIKYAGAERDALIENYRQSIRNLGACGIDTICYNFMPVIDWIRTDLHHQLPNGAESLYFDYAKFVAFDMFILKRKNAANDYSPEIVNKATNMFAKFTQRDINQLIDTIIVTTQGFIDGNINSSDSNPVDKFNRLLAVYDGIDRNRLRANLKYFLDRVALVAQEAGVRLCIHPDDPPMQVLGLPRIVCDAADIDWILDAVDIPANGLTLCAGSLSAGIRNDVPAIAKQFAQRIHFIHLRSTELLSNGDFYEASHLGGRGNLPEVIRIMLYEQERRIRNGRNDIRLPFRVDHGHRIAFDYQFEYNPGYPFMGRMKALAEVSGMMHVLANG